MQTKTSVNAFYGLFISFFLLNVPQGISQPFTDIATLNYHYHIPQEYVEDQAYEKRNAELLGGELLLPFPLGQGSYLIAGGQYSRIALRFWSDERDVQVFSSTEGRIGLLYQWKNPGHNTLLMSTYKWNGEENTFLDGDQFQIGAAFLHAFQLTSELTLKAGLYYNHEFYGHYFVPLGGIDWRINETLWLYGILPANLQLHKTVSDAFAISTSFTASGGSFLLNDKQHYMRAGQGFPPYSILSLDVHFQIIKPMILKWSVGHSIWRNYGLYTLDDVKTTTGKYADEEDGPVFRLSLIARISQIEN